jgi:hypothetical protein
MSLLDGPDTVTVYPQVITGKTKYGTWKTERGEGIVVEAVTVAPFGVGSFSDLESVDSVNDQMTVKGIGEWPGGVKSIIEFEGVEYDQEGLPKEFTRGLRTQHYVVRIKRRGAEVK